MPRVAAAAAGICSFPVILSASEGSRSFAHHETQILRRYAPQDDKGKGSAPLRPWPRSCSFHRCPYQEEPMKTVAGIFPSTSAAERGAGRLAEIGVPRPRIRQLTPNTPERQIHSIVPIAETEQPGMGKAIGAVVGFVVGAMIGLVAFGVLRGGAAQFSPAVLLGVAALGGCGGVAGAFAGRALE